MPLALDCRALVDRIVASLWFCGSARRGDMLCYMVHRVLDESASEIHEDEIGTRLFGRQLDYDKGVDPIVRVQASHLRKRLAQYFESEGALEAIVLDIPKGAYVPVFRYRSEPLETTNETAARAAQRPLAITLLAGACLLLAVTCTWLAMHSRLESTSAGEKAPQPYIRGLYGRLITPTSHTSLIVADSSFGLLQDALGHPIPLDLYLARDPQKWLEKEGRIGKPDANLDHVLEMLAYRQYTSLADLMLANKISLLLSPLQRARLSIHYARDYSVRAANSENLILFGSERSNPWVQLFNRYLDFQFVEEVPGRITVVDRKPRPGDPSKYPLPAMSHSGREGYSVLALLPGMARDSSVLLIAGTDMEATETAGGVATSESDLASVLKHVWADISKPTPYFEL